jgi:membrane protease YdiL (CAAX protease family)
MQNSDSNIVRSRIPSIGPNLLTFVGFLVTGMAVGNILAIIFMALYVQTDLEHTADLLAQLFSDPTQVKNGWWAMMILQGTAHFFSYLLPSVLFWYLIERKTIPEFNNTHKTGGILWLLSILLVLIFIPANSQFISWNAQMTFPDALSWLEKWMRDKENQMETLTSFMTNFQQPEQFVTALVVVALLPALGEEFLFRGVLQNKLRSFWKNPHIAIWVSAAIFSAIHFQFYGFIPRMLLGAIFGYLYFWSGNLWLAVLAHFVNNGFALLMVYLHNIGVVNSNLEDMKTMPLSWVIPSFLLSITLLYFIKSKAKSNQMTSYFQQ